MGRIFGTDGARGIVGSELDALLSFKIGVATVQVLNKDKKKKLTFLIGSDTRISKDVLKYALASGILSENADVYDLGVIPTPAIAYLVTKYHADGGFVISASHNPCESNGIKIFNQDGYKLADELELEIEDLILNNFALNKEVNRVGTFKTCENALEDYVAYLKETVDKDNFKNLNIGIDTANGASFQTAKMLFTKLGANFKIINDNPDGYNINKDAGSTHLEGLQKFVIDNKLDLGIAFDGDADRVLMVDEEGNVVDGDKILAIISKHLKEENKLKNNTLVGTVMSNLGLIKFCEKEDINFVATKVGDRYVLESMLKNDYVVGGEQSGHVIFREYATTGDGELTAIQILNILGKDKKKLSELASIMETYPQVLKNVKVSKEGKDSYQQNTNIMNFIKEQEDKLNGNGRILVRASGTENLIRVMIEGKDIDYITKMCDDIVALIASELN